MTRSLTTTTQTAPTSTSLPMTQTTPMAAAAKKPVPTGWPSKALTAKNELPTEQLS